MEDEVLENEENVIFFSFDRDEGEDGVIYVSLDEEGDQDEIFVSLDEERNQGPEIILWENLPQDVQDMLNNEWEVIQQFQEV